MKTSLVPVVLVTGILMTAEATPPASPAPASSVSLPLAKRSTASLSKLPAPLVTSLLWTNAPAAHFRSLPKAPTPSAPLAVRPSPPATQPAPLLVAGTNGSSKATIRVVNAPLWLTNATAVSNALSQVPKAESKRPLPPTGLRVIAVSN